MTEDSRLTIAKNVLDDWDICDEQAKNSALNLTVVMIDDQQAHIEKLERLIRHMNEAIDAGHVDSAEICMDDPYIPPHKFHEEWHHWAKNLIG